MPLPRSKKMTFPLYQGKPLLKYQDVSSLNLSPALLFDQMYRHYISHREGGNTEAMNFQMQLESRLSYMDSEIDSLKSSEYIDFPCDVKSQLLGLDNSDDSSETDLDIKKLMFKIVQDLRTKGDQSKKAQLDQHRIKFLELLRIKHETLEYLQIVNSIMLNKDQDTPESSINSSIDSLKDNKDAEASPSSIISLPPQSSQTPFPINLRTPKLNIKPLEIEVKEEQINNLDKLLKSKQKELEDLNLQLIHSREDLLNSCKSSEHQASASLTQELDDTSQYSIQSEALDSEAEVANNEYPPQEELLSLPLSQSFVKKKIKELLSQTISTSTKDSDTYSRGKKALELDFIRFGRKTWNDKDVKLFLRIMKGYKKQQIDHSDHQPHLKVQNLKNILNTTQQIINMSQDLKKYLDAQNKDMTDELEKFKSQKSKYLPLQLIHDNFQKISMMKLEDLQNLCHEQIIQIQTLEHNIIETEEIKLKEDIIKRIDKHLSDHWDKLQSLLNNTTLHPLSQDIQKDIQERPPVKKLIIVPQESTDIREINDVLRQELKKEEVRPKIFKTKITKNNNIELQTTEVEAKKLSDLLKTKKEKLNIIDPDGRKMKILLLRVPSDITKEDLDKELRYHNYFTQNKFEIIKSMFAKNKRYQNWIIEASARDCRNLKRLKTIQIYIDKVRIEFYIRVLRCTNCQALNDHPTSKCTYQTVCAKCTGLHPTKDCDKNFINCINCQRYQYDETNHEAYSLNCPAYSEERAARLYNYYRSHQNELNYSKQFPRMNNSYNQHNFHRAASLDSISSHNTINSSNIGQNKPTLVTEYDSSQNQHSFTSTPKPQREIRTVRFRTVYYNSNQKQNRGGNPPHFR